MKTKTIVLEIDHDDLVNLFSTGLDGSNYLDADYESNDVLADCECFEDKLAQSVLAGRSITFRDMYAEGYAHGELPRVIDDNDEDVIYTVTLEDIKRGLEKAADICPWAFRAFADYTSDWDYYAGDALLQIIIFGELIYG